MHPGILGVQAYIIGMDGDGKEDVMSIESFSTTATADDNPGTGRVLDTYFFQPIGRRIERLAMRFTIRYLHPRRIEAFMSRGIGCYPWFAPKLTLSHTLREIDGYWSGPTFVSGLKSLVQQAQ